MQRSNPGCRPPHPEADRRGFHLASRSRASRDGRAALTYVLMGQAVGADAYVVF